MKLAVLSSSLLLMACLGTIPPRTVKIAVLDTPAGHSHSEKVIEIIESNYMGTCPLEVRLFAIYDKGNLTVQGVRTAAEEGWKFSPDIMNISWNTLYRRPYDPIVRELEKVSRNGFLVAAAVDDPVPRDGPGSSGTVMGKVSKALVIGALSRNGAPTSDNFRGELLTAVAPPEGTLGSSFTAALFTATLAERICRDPEYDVGRLLERKQKIRKRLPSLEELFRE